MILSESSGHVTRVRIYYQPMITIALCHQWISDVTNALFLLPTGLWQHSQSPAHTASHTDWIQAKGTLERQQNYVQKPKEKITINLSL